MIPIDLVIAMVIGVWYIVVSVVVFKNIRIQTALQEKIFNENIAQTNALNGILMELKDLNSKHK